MIGDRLIPFELTATQIGSIDSANYTLVTLSAATSLARVPRALILYKPAGVAYTCGAGSRIVVKDDDNNILFSVACDGFIDQSTAQSRYVESATSGKAFNANSLTFLLACTGSVADGGSSPNVKGKLFYDEFPIVW